jgi:hypothetical protein
MVFPGRSKENRRPWRSPSSVIVAGLLGLAMAASLLLVFSESVQLLRIAVVVALWAATVGAIAMTKYRRESALDRAKVDDLKTVYELQLEREISARREYELTVEEKVRTELRLDADEMSSLRAELAALRRNLEVLFDGRLPVDAVALQDSAQRARELHGATRVTAPRPSGPAFASPDDEPLTAETTTVSPEQNDKAAAETAEAATPADKTDRTATNTVKPGRTAKSASKTDKLADKSDKPAEKAGKSAPVEAPGESADKKPGKAEPAGKTPPDPASKKAPAAKPQPAADTVESDDEATPAEKTPSAEKAPSSEEGEEPTGRQGRRRLAEDGAHTQGRSVAEILAALSNDR